MGRAAARRRLQQLAEEVPDSGRIEGWAAAVASALAEGFGVDHDYYTRFTAIEYSPSFWTSGTDRSYFEKVRLGALGRAEDVVKAALRELDESDVADSNDYDPALWRSISGLVESGDWPKVAASTAIFLENQLRLWANLPASVYGKKVAVAVFNPTSGKYPCGDPDANGEQEGWQSLAIGLFQAVGNVDRHRVQDREDVRTYAMGVVGTASLLLTQLRMQHGLS